MEEFSPKPFDGGQRSRAYKRKRELEQAAADTGDLPVIEMDRQAVFMVYLATSGDVKRTAEECKIDAVALQRMVDEENWKEKIQPLLTLKKTAKPKEIERLVNRTLNFATITRTRMVLDKAVKRLHEMGDDEFFKYLFRETTTITRKKDGTEEEVTERKLDTRGLTDLTSAIEKAQMMSYYALNDTTPDRARRLKEEDDESGPSIQEIHTTIAEAMSKATASQSPRALVFDQQVAKDQTRVIEQTLQDELAEAQQ